jgi:hypothetical protein
MEESREDEDPDSIAEDVSPIIAIAESATIKRIKKTFHKRSGVGRSFLRLLIPQAYTVSRIRAVEKFLHFQISVRARRFRTGSANDSGEPPGTGGAWLIRTLTTDRYRIPRQKHSVDSLPTAHKNARHPSGCRAWIHVRMSLVAVS